jgi:hypothetical protein
MQSLYFALVMLVIFNLTGRKLGWFLSKNYLYKFDVSYFQAIFITVIWVCMVFSSVIFLINFFHPNLIIKIIFGYGAGLYVAIPNFGLLNESSIPEFGSEKDKHLAISHVPSYLFLILVIGYEVVVNL